MIGRSRRGLRRGHFFNERVPCAAIGATPDPLWLLATAFLTRKHRLRSFHSDDGTSSRGWWLVVGGWWVLQRARAAQHSRGKHQDPSQEAEHPAHRDADKAKWK